MSGTIDVALVRPMVVADIDQAATVTAEAFATDISSSAARHSWEQRLLHSLRHDPEGSFVSVRERDGAVTGAAQAVIRENLWVLSLMAVSPTLGEGGEGRALMHAALGYDRGCSGGLIIASDDPRALRLYSSSGFSLEATFKATGTIDPALLPQARHPGITAVPKADLATLGPISRFVRGAVHTPDIEVPLFRGSSVFRLGDRGFVVTTPGRGLWALAARDEDAGRALLWHALAEVQDEPAIDVGWISGAQQWAIEVLMQARLSVTSYGAICTRGQVGPLHPYIPSPSFA